MKSNQIKLNQQLEKIGGFIPFIALFLIALIKTDSMTYHQKVFKTLIILIVVIVLTLIYFSSLSKHKKFPLHYINLFFAIYFFLFFFQYVVSFFSKEISYDRDYYLANYICLLLFSLYTFLFLKDESDLRKMFLTINFFLVILGLMASFSFYDHYHFPQKISTSVVEKTLFNDAKTADMGNFKRFYIKNRGEYQLSVPLDFKNKQAIKSTLKRLGYYTSERFVFNLSKFRPALTFGNTNYFAGFVLALLPLTFLSIFILRNKQKKFYKDIPYIFALLGSFGGLCSLMITQTTSAFMGLYFAIVFLVIPALLITTKRFRKTTKAVLLSANFLAFFIIPVLLIIFAPQIIKTIAPRLLMKLNAPVFVLYDRINGWTPAWNLFLKHPITGAGLGTMYPLRLNICHHIIIFIHRE